MSENTETIQGLPLRDIVVLLDPLYTPHSAARPLVRRELLEYAEGAEEYGRTAKGDKVAAEIRHRCGLRFVHDTGGGRWHLNDRGIHCGEGLEMLLGNGTWLPVRFEVAFDDHLRAENDRLPRFYVATAGGPSLKGIVQDEEWDKLVFRWPPKRD